MTINLANNNPRIEYSVAQGVTQQTFAVPFEFFDDGDLSVYVDGVLKAEGTDYTTTGGDGSTGTVVFVTAVPPAVQQVTGAVGGSQVVIVRNIPIERTSDFSAGSDINRAALNEQLDILTAMLADLKTKIDRSPTLVDYDVVNYQLTIPPTSQRLNKYLAFGADGNLTTTSGTTSNIVVSSFGQTLVDDVDAPTALQTLGLTATAAELNTLDGITATVAELNVLDGIPATLTATELGYVDGVTSAIQTQLNTKAPTASPTFTGTLTAATEIRSATYKDATGGDTATVNGNRVVAQGGGADMTDDRVYIGWRNDGLGLAAQVNITPLGCLVRNTSTPAGSNNALVGIGSPPLYACRAWANFNGTGTVAIRASGNVTSITDNGVGDYTVNFITSMHDANYCVIGSQKVANDTSLSAQEAPVLPFSTAVGSCRIHCNDDAVLTDSANVFVAIIR